MKRAIVTGGTGALGIALIKYLLKKGYNVTVIVNPSSTRINRIPNSDNVKIIRCDLSELIKLKGSLTQSYEQFYHLAWIGTSGVSRNDMELQLQNIKYTLDAVYLASTLQCKVFIGAGSQAEYGLVNEKLTEESYPKPESGYGMAKLCAGQMSRNICKVYGIKHIWLRVLSVYGPYDGFHTLISSTLIKLVHNQRPLFTKAEQIWDFIYSEDAAMAFYLAAKDGKDGECYNIGSGMELPLSDYIKMIWEIIQPPLELKFGDIPYNNSQVMHLSTSIDKLKNDTGFDPKVSFSDGILFTYKWLKEVLGNEKS